MKNGERWENSFKLLSQEKCGVGVFSLMVPCVVAPPPGF